MNLSDNIVTPYLLVATLGHVNSESRNFQCIATTCTKPNMRGMTELTIAHYIQFVLMDGERQSGMYAGYTFGRARILTGLMDAPSPVKIFLDTKFLPYINCI